MDQIPRATESPPKTLDDRSGGGSTRHILFGRIPLTNNERAKPVVMVAFGLLVFTGFGLFNGFGLFSLLFTLVPLVLAASYLVDVGYTHVEVSIADGELRVRRSLGPWVRERRVPIDYVHTAIRRELGTINDMRAHHVEIRVTEGKKLGIGKGYPEAHLEWLAKHLNDGVQLAQRSS